jgi:cob(I)alamin adenosyltransferase
MKIYTKTGDQGKTGLLGGLRVSKHHPCIEVCGSLDELNSWIGVIRSQSENQEINSRLEEIQNDLFNIGAAVAGCLGETSKKSGIGVQPDRAEQLEQWMDDITETLPPQRAFLLPGGAPTASWTHLARNVCRRAERNLVLMLDTEETKLDLSRELVFLNRLSDLLFLLARSFNFESNHAETEWHA